MPLQLSALVVQRSRGVAEKNEAEYHGFTVRCTLWRASFLAVYRFSEVRYTVVQSEPQPCWTPPESYCEAHLKAASVALKAHSRANFLSTVITLNVSSASTLLIYPDCVYSTIHACALKACYKRALLSAPSVQGTQMLLVHLLHALNALACLEHTLSVFTAL